MISKITTTSSATTLLLYNSDYYHYYSHCVFYPFPFRNARSPASFPPVFTQWDAWAATGLLPMANKDGTGCSNGLHNALGQNQCLRRCASNYGHKLEHPLQQRNKFIADGTPLHPWLCGQRSYRGPRPCNSVATPTPIAAFQAGHAYPPGGAFRGR